MQGTGTGATSPAKGIFGPVSQADTPLFGRREQPWRRWLVVLILVLSDLLLAFLIWELASVLQSSWGRGSLTHVSTASIVVSLVVWLVLRALLGLYPGYGLNQPEELRRQTYAIAATLAIIALLALALQIGDLLSRLVVGLGCLSLLVLAPLVRHLIKRGMLRIGLWGKPVLILGTDKDGAQLARILKREWNLGFRPIAVFGDPLALAREKGAESVPYEGTLTEVIDVAQKQRIDTIIFATPHVQRKSLVELVDKAGLYFRHVIVIPDLNNVTNSAVVARDFAGTLGVEIKHNLLNPWVLRIKRTLDIGITVVGATLIFPLFLLISCLILLDSAGPVFYRDQRLGQDGKLYTCIKFRTMVLDADVVLPHLIEQDQRIQQEYLQYHKLRRDPRITRVGRFLRNTSLDELPQFWNVLRGEMSLIGPRPYKLHELADSGPVVNEILRVPPGISGLWQVAGRNDISFERRVEIDSYYVRNWSIWLDLVIIARTVRSIISRRGAY